MTWNALMNATLGLMFSNTNGSNKVEPSAANVQEYVLNMPDAANHAFSDLAEVCPVVMEQHFVLPLENPTISLKDTFPLYHKLLTEECYLVSEDGPVFFDSYFLHGDHQLTFLPEAEGEVVLSAVVLPCVISDSFLPDTEISYPPLGLSAVSYFMAHRLYFEDDVQLSMHYLNYYESLKAELNKLYSRTRYSVKAYTNKAGWL